MESLGRLLRLACLEKLTKTAVDAATPKDRDYELRDTIAPGFMLKVTPFGSKIFMLAYVNSSGIRRKPALGRFGELTVDRARKLAQDWRRSGTAATHVPRSQPPVPRRP